MENTGYRGYTTLEEYDVNTGEATGNTKPNVEGDPDYVPTTPNLNSCPAEPYLKVDTSYIVIPQNVGGVTVNVTTNTQWKITNVAPWMSIHTSETNGDGEAVVSFPPNTGNSSKTLSFTISSTNTSLSKVIIIVQQIEGTSVMLAFNPNNSNCGLPLQKPNIYYYTGGSSFLHSTKLWYNEAATMVVPAGYYSDGNVSRHWDGSKFTVSYLCGFGF